MNITLRTSNLTAYLTVKSGNAVISENVADYISNEAKTLYTVPESFIENLITIARDLNNFNDKTDIEFVKMIYKTFLNDTERKQFLKDCILDKQEED